MEIPSICVATVFALTGGPTLTAIEQTFGAHLALPLYCSANPETHRPRPGNAEVDLGYLGTYSADRQHTLERLLTDPARRWRGGRFTVAGPCYPQYNWPSNVTRVEHVGPDAHVQFYRSLRFTLNVTRADMIARGYSPSVRLFEAAACAVPIISDSWAGIDEFFEPGREILLAEHPEQVLTALMEMPESERIEMGNRARARVLAHHTSQHRAEQLEHYIFELRNGRVSQLRALEATARQRRLKTHQRCELIKGVMSQLLSDIQRLEPWFHNLHLPDGTQTCPSHTLGDFPRFKWEKLASHIPDDLRDATVLDIGCNAGFYSLELARRGALVTGIDVDEHYLTQARWAAEVCGLSSRIKLERRQVYELAHTTHTWDIALFLGVLYHLRYPLLGLDIVSRCVNQTLIVQSLTAPGDVEATTPANLELLDREPLARSSWPKLAFIENCMAGDRTNWWAPNRACMEAMLRSSGMRIASRPQDEFYIATPDRHTASSMWTWNSDEYWAAVQKHRMF